MIASPAIASPSSSPAAAELFIDACGPLLRAAVVRSGRLTDLAFDSHSLDPAAVPTPDTGSVWRGRVERLAAGLNAAFIDLGCRRPGLLGVTDVRINGSRPPGAATIGTLLSAGQSVLVQVKAEATGSKGPTLSMEVSLPGRWLVHAPFRRGVTVSRRLGEGAARAALTRRIQGLVVGDGWIARSGAVSGADSLIAAEADALALCWRTLLEQGTPSGRAPGCLLPAPSAAQRVLIDLGGRGLSRLVIETRDPAAATWAEYFRDWLAGNAPDLAGVLEHHRGPAQLFESHDLEGRIAALVSPRVPLDGGGNLMIEPTEALTAIDVNGGERGNPLAVNLEAAGEIARQLRLRNIGGIVVIDFLSMTKRDHGQRLLDTLAAAVAEDPVQTEVYGLSKLGLVELTRARRGPRVDSWGRSLSKRPETTPPPR